MTAESRIAPGSLREAGSVTWAATHIIGWAAGIEAPKLFLTLARHRRLYRRWLMFAYRLMPGGLLPRRESELVILRVAHLRECEYERRHHHELAIRAGLGPDELSAVASFPDSFEWSPRERTLLLATDALVMRHDLTDDEWAELRTHLNEAEIIELCLLVGHYEMLATTIQALRIQPDERVSRRRFFLQGKTRTVSVTT